MILIIWLLRCSLVSLGLRVLRRKLLKGAVLQVAVVNALAACFHHLLWVVGSKEIWWVDTGKGAEEARGTGCRWEQEASVWQQALQREVLYFLFFPFVQACLPYSLPTNYYYYDLFSDIALSSYIPVMSYVRASSLPCVVFGACGSQFWELGFSQAFSSFHLISYWNIAWGNRQPPCVLFPLQNWCGNSFLASLSSLSQAKAHTSLERKEDLETLELLVWTASKEEDGHGLSSSSTMPGGVYGRAYDQRGYTVPFHEAIQKSNTKRQCNVLALNTGQPVRAGQTLPPAADRSWGRGLVGREEIVDGLQRRREAYERFWWKDL